MKRLSKFILSYFLSFLYIFLMFIYAISTLSVSSLSYTRTLSFQFPLTLLLNNWNTPFLTSLSARNSNCDSKTNSLFMLHLPTISSGCMCPSNNSFVNEFTKILPCASECKFINAGINETFDFWKEDWKLCGGIVEGSSFLNSISRMSGGECPKGERICGEYPDTAVCVNSAYKCPITSLVVSELNPDPFRYMEFIEYHDSLKIFIEREGKDPPIVEGIVSQILPCEDTKVINLEGEEYIHPLMEKSEIHLGCRPDPRWKELVSITARELWKGRGETRLPGGSGRDNWANMGLYRQFYRNVVRAKADASCRNGVKKISNAGKVYQTTLDTQRINLGVTVAMAIGCMIFYPYLEIMYILGYNGLMRKINNEKMKGRARKLKNTIIVAIKLFHLPFIIVTFTISFVNMKIFDEFNTNNCSDEFTNSIFGEAAENLKFKSFAFNISSLTIVSTLVIIDISLILHHLINNILKEKRKRIHRKPQEIEISQFQNEDQALKGKKE